MQSAQKFIKKQGIKIPDHGECYLGMDQQLGQNHSRNNTLKTRLRAG